jgi:hypothetical protein
MLERERVTNVVLLDPVPLAMVTLAVELDDQPLAPVDAVDRVAVKIHLELGRRHVETGQHRAKRVVEGALARRLTRVHEPCRA